MRTMKHLPKGKPNWSGSAPVPAVGSQVKVNHSDWGTVNVKGYTVEDGFLGVVAEPLTPPEWWVEQKKRKRQRQRNVVFFGVEIEA